MSEETKQIGADDIEHFLHAYGYSFDIEEDNKFHAYKGFGFHALSKDEKRLYQYCLEHFLETQLGVHYKKLYENIHLICNLAGMEEKATNDILWGFKFLEMVEGKRK